MGSHVEQTRGDAVWGQPGDAFRTACPRLPTAGALIGDSLGKACRHCAISAGQVPSCSCGQTFLPPPGVSVLAPPPWRVGTVRPQSGCRLLFLTYKKPQSASRLRFFGYQAQAAVVTLSGTVTETSGWSRTVTW